ncbi:autotransporter domain-containing protein [Helicobacter jaachi]|uniref:Autotransporter domain-containing protein n=1 Tax=Helicobacter jaachi TaxID=1677920 RepID=A0A4U8T8Q6_9HELI|nr:autotransporter domain-containing protein [Helicobacter jaachi]TLD96089.1 autotransporter domain-containing protein [Helicobacter jaachi]
MPFLTRNFIKTLPLFVLLQNLCAIDYQDTNLPTNITLNGGQRSDTITSSRGNGQATTIGYGRNPNLNISGTQGSQYQLQVQDSTTTWYSGGLNIGSNIQAALIGVHTLSIERNAINVGSGASLSIISSGNTINAQTTDYGGDSKIHFSDNTRLYLAQNASATFSNSLFFIHNGTTTLEQDSKLNIESKVIRIQNAIQNNGGEITFTGKVQNIGSNLGGYGNNSTSTFENNSGTSTINGDFYNGGQADVEKCLIALCVFDPGFGGGGNLVINGGKVSINGRLISTHGGDMMQDGSIFNAQNAEIRIYGGTLEVTGGVTNNVGSTLRFGARNGKMGQLVGNLTNNAGAIIVDIAGADLGTYTLVTGTISGNQTLSIAHNDFIHTTQNANAITLRKNQAAIDAFSAGLSGNESAILNALDSGLNGRIYTYGNSAYLSQTLGEINNNVRALSLNAPISTWNLLTNITTQLHTQPKQDNLSITPLFSNERANNAKGTLYGAQLGFSKYIGAHFLSGFAAYGLSNQADSIMEKQGSNMLVGLSNTFNLSYFKLMFMGHYAYSTHHTKRTTSLFATNESAQFNSISANAQFGYQEFGLKAQMGLPLSLAHSLYITPYVGLQYNLMAQGAFHENSTDVLSIAADAYRANMLNIAFGAQGKYYVKNYALFSGFEIAHALLKPQSMKVSLNGQPLSYDYDNVLSYTLYVGGSVPLYGNLYVSIYGLYARSSLNFSTISGNLSFMYQF